MKTAFHDADPTKNPNNKRVKKMEINMYGLKELYENLVNFDCKRISDIANADFFKPDNINTILGEEINFKEDEDLDFVPTDEAKIRIATILLAAKSHIFLLITGPTSSAKTYSVFVAYKFFFQKQINEINDFEKRPLRINLSEETSRDDLIGSIVYDEKKCQFIFQSGPFTEAYEKGLWLLIDELSLAPPSVLQAIEAALDSKHLTVQKIGQTEEIEMNPNFNLICTTNPNNEDYSRYIIPTNFYDRFLSIQFDNLSNDEMKKILMKKCNGVDENDIEKIINSHFLHTSETGPKCKNMYTLRELDKARFLFKQNFKVDKIIDIIYHTRSGEDLVTYDSTDDNNYKKIKDFIPTDDRIKYMKIALDCLENGFNIILENNYSEGTSYLAEVIAKIYAFKVYNKEEQPLIINMTDELHVSDITEFSVPRLSKNDMEIKRVKGIIYQAMTQGKVVIINDLERGKTRVIESLNDVYECNLLDEKSIGIKRNLTINKNFRIIFTFHSNVPHKLSAAFFNRFIHIKMKPTGEISGYFKLQESIPINRYSPIFPEISDVSADVQYLCKKKMIAPTSQIETFYALTKQSVEKRIPVCLSSEIGYGLNLGMHLYLDEIYDSSKIHTIYCTLDTSVEQLIGKYVFEGELLFQEGELLRAAINGDIIIFNGIEKLTYHTFSCLESILDCLKDEKRELIIPGICVSEYKLSKNFHCLATIDINNNDHKDFRHISKYFHILPIESKNPTDSKDYRTRIPIPTRDDYLKISKVIENLYTDYSEIIDNVITCFLSCYEKRNIFDITFRMFNRIITSIPDLIIPKSPIEEAICIFALFQNVNENTLNDLLTSLNGKLTFDYTKVEELIKNDVKIQNNQLVKGPLSFPFSRIDFEEEINDMSTEQLNAIFYLVGIKSPKILVGPTSFKETLIKKYQYQQRVRVFNATSDTSIGDIIGGTSFKKNHPQSGRFGHGEIFDLLIGYMQIIPNLNAQINNLDFHSLESFNAISSIINQMDEGTLKPYFEYLIEIVKKGSQYATFFELGFIVRELLLGHSVLLKNVDELKESIIDSIIPFLNDSIKIKDCLPGDFNHLNEVLIENPSIYFTCSESKYNRLPASFRSRVQAIHVKNLTKDDLKLCVDDIKLLDAYDLKVKDYSDIMRSINIIKIASVLNNFNTTEERIEIATKILSQDHNIFDNNNKKTFELEELIKYDEKTGEVISLRTGAAIKVKSFNDEKIKELVYVPSIALLLDLVIISFATHIPLIVESSPGQAKSTFIRDFGYAIDKEVTSSNMSKNKSTEEFIGQIVPNEDGFSYEIGILYKQLVRDEIYLIDEFNLASPSLLSLFLNVFKAQYGSNVVHPHKEGPFIKTFDIVATMNPANLTAGRMFLPSGFTSCSLVYKMPDYSESDISIIIAKIFNKEQYASIFKDYEETIKFIGQCHALGMNQSNDVTIRDILKLHEIFKSSAFDDEDASIRRKSMKNKIKIASYVELIYSSKMTNCMYQFDEIFRKYLGTENMAKIPDNVIKEQYRLKKQIKDALGKTNRGLIIEGPSGSGKTECIIDIANGEFDGKKHTVHTIQLCAESDISELLGRYEPLYSEKNEIHSSFIKKLNSGNFRKELSGNENTVLDKYLPDLSKPEKVEETLEKITMNSLLMNKNILVKAIDHFRKNWKHISFDYIESLLVKAMRNGDWVVLDNINLCPGDILESLNSLLEENHILYLPNDYIFAMDPDPNNPKILKINPNFRIIMTSDDQILNTSHIIPAPFLSRCIVLRIKKPETHDLALIGLNNFNIPYYTDFMSKCFLDESKSHVRDIIRMANVCQFLHHKSGLEIEDEIGKTIKFILNNNYHIPEKYKNSKKDGDNIYRFIISIIQTNLIDYKLENDSFAPFVLPELIQTIQSLQESDLLNTLFKETLKLACYVFSTKPFKKHGENYTIRDKLIPLLLCGYILTNNPKKQVPDCFWELKFSPAIWDFVFVARDEYDKFTNLYGFKQFIELHTESEEFICEFYNYFKKDVNEISDETEEYFDVQINKMFKRTSIEIENCPLDNPNKNEIEIEKIPISFPSIPNNKVILSDPITYYSAIELLDWLEITPNLNILKTLNLNINLENKSIFKKYKLLILDSMDLYHAQTYNLLFTEYDLTFHIFKEISDIQENTENLLSLINDVCNKYNIKIGDLSGMNSKFQVFCNKEQNKCSVTKVILNVLIKAEHMIQFAYEQKRMKRDFHNKQNENRKKALNILNKTQNLYIREQIQNLMETYINEEKINEIIKLGMIDKYITSNNNNSEPKYSNCKYICPYNFRLLNCKEIELSVIIAKFIIQAHCREFNISDNIYRILNKKMSTTDIQTLLNDITTENLNKEQINYHFIEILLEKLKFQPITMEDVNSRETISDIISNMNQYSVYDCIVLDSSKPKDYIIQMQEKKNFFGIDDKLISHLDSDTQDNIYDEHSKLIKEIRKSKIKLDIIPIHLLKEKCPSIPIEDYGHTVSLKYDEQFEGNPIAEFAHFLTEQEKQKIQIEKQEIRSTFIKGHNYKIISIESLIVNLIYISNYQNIENSLANDFNMIDTNILHVLHPSSPPEILKKDIIIFLSEKNKNEINDNEKRLIKENADILFSSENIDINNYALNTLYNDDFRKRKVQYIIEKDERKKIQIAVDQISLIINNTIKQIEENFKFLINTKPRRDIEREEGPRIFDDVYELAQYILKPITNKDENGYKISKNGEKFIQKASEINKLAHRIDKFERFFPTIYSEDSLKPDPTIKPNIDCKISKCKKDYFNYRSYAEKIKWVSFSQFQISEMYLKEISRCRNPDIEFLCNQALISLKVIQEIGNHYQLLKEPYLPKIHINPKIEPPANTVDLLIIGHFEGGITLLNEVDYDLGNCLPNSLLKINIFNITNAKIRTEPVSQIHQINDRVISSMKLKKENQMIEMKIINNLDSSKIGQINFNCTFQKPKIYLMFSKPIKIKGNSISIKGTIYQEFSIFIYSDTSLMYNILRIDDIDSEFTENQIDIDNKNNDKITFVFKKQGKFKAQIYINFPLINLTISSIIDVKVKTKKRTYMYMLNYLDDPVECRQKVELGIPSFVAIKIPLILQCSKNIEIENNINNNEYLHLAYVSNNSAIKTPNGNVNFAFRSVYLHIKYQDKFVPQLSKFVFNVPTGGFGYFKYFDDEVIFTQLKRTETIVQLYYEHDKLKSLTFRGAIYHNKEGANYDENGIFYESEDKYNNRFDILLEQIQERQNIHFDTSTKFTIPWICIIRLFDKTKEELHDYMISEIINNFKLRNEKTYYVVAEENNLQPINKIPDEILSDKKIKPKSRRIVEIRTEKYDHLGEINFDNLYEILANVESLKLGLLMYRQIFDYKKEIALNIFKIYNVLKSLGQNGIMLNTFNEIISIGNILFNNLTKLNTIEVINDKYNTKSQIIFNSKQNKISDFIFDSINSSVYGVETDEFKNYNSDIHYMKIKYKPITIESILKSKEYNDLYEIFTKKQTKKTTKPTIVIDIPDETTNEDSDYKDAEPSDLIAAQINVTPKEIDESEYPEYAYSMSISKKTELYSLTNLEKINDKNFIPDDAVLADGDIPNLDKYVFNVITTLIQTNFPLFIPNEHITLLIDISELSGSRYKNELCVNMMVSMHVLTAFDIPFSVWLFASRNLCFCVKKPEDVFDKKRQCLIRDAYFLKRKNQYSYVLSALDTVTRLKLDKKTNMFIIFSTFVSSQTLRPYDEWKQIALSCTSNKHVICMFEPYQYTNDKVDYKLSESMKDSDFIHIIKYTNICDSNMKLITQIFSLSKNFSKGFQSIKVDSINTQLHKFKNTTEFQDNRYYCFKNLIDIKKIKSRNIELKNLDLTNIKGDFEVIKPSQLNDLGDINHIASIMLPNKPTKYELSSHGYTIDIKGLINSYLSKFTNLNIFKQKTGEKIREYCADFLIDCSNIIKMYSIDHCFISIISLLFSLKELNIPYVNLVVIGKHLVPLLINQDLKYISNNDFIYSKLYCLLFEEASETRLLEEGIRQVLAHSLFNSIPHIMFVITDAILGQEHEEKIKDILSFAELNGTKVIGIGTGPAPYRIDDIFNLSVYSKNPYILREALYHLTQITITKNKFIPFTEDFGLPPIMKSESNTNDEILDTFAKIPFINDHLLNALNKKSFDSKNFDNDKDYYKKSEYDCGVDGEYKGYKVLIIMFYEGSPDSDDKNITVNSFLNGPRDERYDYITSPKDKLTDKGFDYNIVTTYKDAMNELLKGEYSIAILATASNGYEGNKKNDSNYLEPFLIAIERFYRAGGALMLFGENPPFIFEVNLILKQLGVNVMFDENESERGGGTMFASQSSNGVVEPGCFLNPEYTFNATINGSIAENLLSIGGGISKLAEGRTLAVFKTTDGSKIEDSFRIFSRSSKGKPACIFKIPKGREGVIFIDNGASKLFNEYNEEGAARYISNMSIGCIHFSHFREFFQNDLGKETIKIEMTEEEKAPKLTKLMKKKPPLLITILIDATSSMQPYINECKKNLSKFVEKCINQIEQLKIYIQVIAYRDFNKNHNENMVEPYPITDSLRIAIENIAAIKEDGGADEPENISIGFETALNQIEEFKKTEPNCKNIFILVTDSPNHDADMFRMNEGVRYNLSADDNLTMDWKDIWLRIDERMKKENINKLVCIDVDQKENLFSKYQYDNWKKYGCNHINNIVKAKTLQNNSFDDIFVNHISDEVKYMYTTAFGDSH